MCVVCGNTVQVADDEVDAGYSARVEGLPVVGDAGF